ncbi:MAG: helix-turn-helix domain-containing protein [Bacteroidales bacterium]|jgi:transcriptional regulator with XRE-family HTH domain|nr:helix-turn-helix domain-containing protein [Bacteroidales bacterium]
METGKLIKELRLKRGLTQEDLAEKTEVSVRTIQRIESGEVDPRAYTLQMIAKALDVDFSMFVEDNTDDKKGERTVDDKDWCALIHLTGVVPLIFPTLILIKSGRRKSKEISNHFKAAITMQLCIIIICLIGLWIYWRVNQPIPFVGGLLAGGLVSVINAISVMNGKPYINPFIKNTEIKGEQ